MAHWDSSFTHNERLSQSWQRQIELVVSSNILLLQVVNIDGVSGTPMKHKSELLLFDVHYFADVESNTYFCSFMTWSVSLETMIVAMAKDFSFALMEVQNEALLPACWDCTTAENSLPQLSCHLNSFRTSSFQHLSDISYNTRWTSSPVAE